MLENFLFDVEQDLRAVKPESEELKVTTASMYLIWQAMPSCGGGEVIGVELFRLDVYLRKEVIFVVVWIRRMWDVE